MKTRLFSLLIVMLAIMMPTKLLAEDGVAEPYAVLTNDTLLTFYYDDQKSVRGGMDINTQGGNESSPYGTATTAVFDTSFADYRPTSTANWFHRCYSLAAISGMENFKTDNVTDMSGMFSSCYSLKSIDLSHFKTDNVTDMGMMFYRCESLTSLDVSGFNTQNVTNMSDMFNRCHRLASLDLTGFNTQNVTDMSFMFWRCFSLTRLDLTGFNTQNVTGMSSMFSGCPSLTSLDVTGFNTQNVTNMSDMFAGCADLTSLDVTNFNTQNVTDMRWMFSECRSLTSLDVTGFNTQNVTNMSGMFDRCSRLTTIYAGSDWSTMVVTSGNDIFKYCTNLVGGAGTVYDSLHVDYTYAHIDGGPSNPGYFTEKDAPAIAEPYAVLSADSLTVTFYYDGHKAARGGFDINNSDLDYNSKPPYSSATTAVIDASFADYRPTSTAYWFEKCSSLTSITGMENLKTENVTNMSDMFWYCSGLTSLDVTGFNTQNVTNMSGMFTGCIGLTSLDLSGFNTQNVTDMNDMFCDCRNLTSLDLSGFNTQNVTDMYYMFCDCSNLTSLDLSGFDTQNVTNMGCMFYSCSSLTSLDLSGFNTQDVTYMAGMFKHCSGLMSLDVSHFDTQNVTSMYGMFTGCSRLTSLDLSSFNTQNVTDMADMFSGCFYMTTIYVGSEWSTTSVTRGKYMFTNCLNLKGGAGTVYDVYHTDYTYARIDGGTDNPGYFTDKNAPVVEATFDENGVLAVGGSTTMTDALGTVGGLNVVAESITAIVWNSTQVLNSSDLQGIDNPNLLIYVAADSLAPADRNNVVVNGIAKNIVLSDAKMGNNNFYCPQAFTAEMVSYTREFSQQTQVGVTRGWETIALPFTVQAITHEMNATLKPFGAEGNGKPFWLRRLGSSGLTQATRIEANVPYIISMPNNSEAYPAEYNQAGKVTFSAKNVTVPVTEPVILATEDSSLMMVPAFQRIRKSSEVWAINVGEMRGQYLEGSVFERDYRDVRPFEAYIVHKSNSPAPHFLPIMDIGGTTGIDAVEGNAQRIENWYLLDGRKVREQPKRKGVYISGKRKVVVR